MDEFLVNPSERRVGKQMFGNGAVALWNGRSGLEGEEDGGVISFLWERQKESWGMAREVLTIGMDHGGMVEKARSIEEAFKVEAEK